jgi:CheY-like chemotaxis protein
VLIVEDVDMEAKLLMRALADAGYSNLVHRTDVASAKAEIEANHPQLVITDLKLGDLSGIDLTKHVRSLDGGGYVYVIMLTSSGTDAVLETCFDAGVDDFIAKPLRPDTIVARMRAGERILALETSLRMKGRELETALRRIDIVAAQRALAKAADAIEAKPAPGATALDALLGTDSWRDVEAMMAGAMTDFFQAPFVSARTHEHEGTPFVAEISLLEPTKQLELGLSIVIDEPSMKRLHLQLLGDEDLESAKALVLEMSNSLMGVLKAAFMPHGFTFTGGIPSTETFAHSRAAFDKSIVRCRMAIANGPSDAEIWLRVKEKSNTTVRGRALKEGLVIGEDIRDGSGMLLIRAGSRLSQTMADRLAKLAPDLEVTVSDPNG